MSEQIKQAIQALTSRQAVHFIEWYFESRRETFTNEIILTEGLSGRISF